MPGSLNVTVIVFVSVERLSPLFWM